MTSPSATGPSPRPLAWAAVGRCVCVSMRMLARRQVRFPHGNLGRQIHFADGTSARVYRETAVPGRTPGEPCYLAVSFRLRHVRGRGHRLFRMESILNTPLFVGFPGFVSKLWLAHDGEGRYRGLYEWDGADAAARYARSLWRVLELVSEPESIDYRLLPGTGRDDVVEHPDRSEQRVAPRGQSDWWRVTGPLDPAGRNGSRPEDGVRVDEP